MTWPLSWEQSQLDPNPLEQNCRQTVQSKETQKKQQFLSEACKEKVGKGPYRNPLDKYNLGNPSNSHPKNQSPQASQDTVSLMVTGDMPSNKILQLSDVV